MDPVDSNSSNGFISVSYPLDLVDQARKVVLGADRELFLADTAQNANQASDDPAAFSQMSSRLTARLDEFSTLLSSTEFFFEAQNSQTSGTDGEDSAFAQALADISSGQTEADEAFSTTLDLDAQAESVRTVIDEYNELVEWLGSTQSDISQYGISQSLKSDLFKALNSDVLDGIISGTSTVSDNTDTTHVDGTASGTQQAGPFSPKVSETSDTTVEAALSKIGLTLNADGTLDIGETFDQKFKSDVRSAYDVLSGQEGFFTKISTSLDALNNRDSRFNVVSENNTPQVYTRNADVQVRSAYRANVASLLNTFA